MHVSQCGNRVCQAVWISDLIVLLPLSFEYDYMNQYQKRIYRQSYHDHIIIINSHKHNHVFDSSPYIFIHSRTGRSEMLREQTLRSIDRLPWETCVHKASNRANGRTTLKRNLPCVDVRPQAKQPCNWTMRNCTNINARLLNTQTLAHMLKPPPHMLATTANQLRIDNIASEMYLAPWPEEAECMIRSASVDRSDLTQQHTTIDWESRLQHRDLTAKPQAS